jgi:hypothetical protein
MDMLGGRRGALIAPERFKGHAGVLAEWRDLGAVGNE